MKFLKSSKLKYIAQPNHTCKETKWMEITRKDEVKRAFQKLISVIASPVYTKLQQSWKALQEDVEKTVIWM